MRTSALLSATSLFVLTFASQGGFKRQDNAAAIPSELSTIEAEITLPASLKTYLTNVPPSVISIIAAKTGEPQLFEDIRVNPPAWLLALPPSVQVYLLSYIHPEVDALLSLAGAEGLVTTPVPTATGTGTGTGSTPTGGAANGTVTMGKPTVSGKGTGKGGATATTSGGPVANSTNGAKATGGVAAGVLGVMGFLGVAMAL